MERFTAKQMLLLEVMQNLKSPYLVSRFQNHFGIFRIEMSPTIQDKLQSMGQGIANSHTKPKSCPHTITNLIWYYLFSFGTSLGYELFYATFFPFWTWNIDSAVCRKVVNVWVIVMYVGQTLKDIIQWPRPSSPPVVNMEPKYAVEYGMPSTHAMVGVALPFSILYFTMNRYEYSVIVGLFIAVMWCTLVCCSRLYMGMHTVLDIIGGLLLAPALMLVILPISESIDHFQQRSSYSPLVTITIMTVLQILYPKSPRWSPARGDTSVIIGTGTGFAFGTWLNYHLGIVHGPHSSMPYVINFPSFNIIIMALLRTVIGLLCILMARQILKNVLHFILCYIMRLDYKDSSSRRKVIIEIPNKFITYMGIGLVIMYFAPLLFRILGIERKSMHLEI